MEDLTHDATTLARQGFEEVRAAGFSRWGVTASLCLGRLPPTDGHERFASAQLAVGKMMLQVTVHYG